MKQVLCFGDSNTWGYNPKTGDRFPWGVRWTSILQQNIEKDDIRVIEEGLCGRTTIFEDPLRAGRRKPLFAGCFYLVFSCMLAN